MDNKIFSVNGKSFYQFKTALKLLLLDEYDKEDSEYCGSGIKGYTFDNKKGIILYWTSKTNEVINIDNLITDDLQKKYDIDKSLRKYKLSLLNDDRPSIPLNILTCALWEYLISINIHDIEHEDWEEKFDDSDILFERGFRIYTDEWGHIKTSYTIDHYTRGAIKPVWCWYGK